LRPNGGGAATPGHRRRTWAAMRVWTHGILLAALCWSSARTGGGEIVFPPGKLGSAVFRHERHLSNKDLTCAACHKALFASRDRRAVGTMKAIQDGKLCGACHNGEKAFSAKSKCSRCHKPVDRIPFGTDPLG